MLWQIPKSFCLIEQGRSWQSHELDYFPYTENELGFIEIDYSKQSESNAVVKDMLGGIALAAQRNIPIIFNRTGQTFSFEEIPAFFSIGLFTSGTTGKPKLIFHELNEILPANTNKSDNSRWLLCYHPMSFAGLQVILQTIVCGDTLLAAPFRDVSSKAQLALDYRINAISATPSLMRAMLMAWNKNVPALNVITFGGEVCDQATLDMVCNTFPEAKVRHIYATTEAGVLFSVKDGKAGFPLEWIGKKFNDWQMRLDTNELIIERSGLVIATGDRINIVGSRAFFIGRMDNLVNVGGVKVDLELIENSVLQLSAVLDARIFAKTNPITGALVCAEISCSDKKLAEVQVTELVRLLQAAEQPRVIRYVDQISLTDMGKKQRWLK